MNNKFGKQTEAVSPVIGVILMVAITVVLAAVVFVLVNGLSETGEEAPRVTFQKDQEAGQVWVLKTPAGLDWSEFTVTGCTTVPVGSLDPGAVLDGCTGHVRIAHTPTGSLVYETQF